MLLDSCGHSFCAGCASSYFAEALRRGQPLLCPFRCDPPPHTITSNRALRDMAEALGGKRAAPAEGDGLVPLDQLPFSWRAILVADLEAARAAGREGERRHAEVEAALAAAKALGRLNDKWKLGAAMAACVCVLAGLRWLQSQAAKGEGGRKRHEQALWGLVRRS